MDIRKSFDLWYFDCLGFYFDFFDLLDNYDKF